MQEKLGSLVGKIQNSLTAQLSVAIGFDGFVDEIIEVVDKRASFDAYARITSIGQFGERILRAQGLSTNIELVPKTVKLGGNGPIMANALVRAGVGVSYVGALGKPNVDPVFLELVGGCTQVFSVAEPGRTDALEFNDGKIMLGKMESLNEVNWDTLRAEIGENQLQRVFSGVDLVATVNWTMTPYMTEVWQGMLSLMQPTKERDKPFFFVDLADPGKRNYQDIRRALEIIREFNKYYRVVLGLNRKEATEIAEVCDLVLSKSAEQVELVEIVTALSQTLGLWCVLVHPVHEAGACVEGIYSYSPGPFTSQPRLTTGAGDNFNAGFCLGLMLGLSVEESLILGTATSGYYVRQMYSPSWAELMDFLCLWSEKEGEEF